MTTPRVIPWINANRYRRYPFVEDTLYAATPAINMSDAVIVDFGATTYQGNEVILTQVELLVPGLGPRSVTFYLQCGANVFPVNVPENSSFPYTTTVTYTNNYVVRITFDVGVIALLDDNPAGIYAFNNVLRFEPALTSIQFASRVFAIRGITTPPGWVIAAATGTVTVQEKHNVQLALDPTTNTMIISAILGAGEGILCEPPEDDKLLCNQVFLRINGLHAGESGDFQLLGGPGVEVIPDPANHRVIVRSKRNIEETVCK